MLPKEERAHHEWEIGQMDLCSSCGISCAACPSSRGRSAWLVIVPTQVSVIAEFSVEALRLVFFDETLGKKSDSPRLDEVRGSEQSTEKHAHTGNDDIGNSKKGVAATHDSSRTDQDGFSAAINSHGEVCGKEVSSGGRV